ncbi:MAG: hypothetical protein U0Q16_09195 [Bryobacteraceae bacterium]
MRSELVGHDPDRTDWQHDLAVSLTRIGDLLRTQQDFSGTRCWYEQALNAARRLVEREPGRTDWIRELALSYERLGDVLMALDECAEGFKFFEQALKTRRRLAAQQPDLAGLELEMVAPLMRISTVESLSTALAILLRLDAEGRLTDRRYKEDWIPQVRQLLTRANELVRTCRTCGGTP